MALIGNYSVLNKNPGFQIAGSTISDVRSQFNKTGSMRNVFLIFDKKSAQPNGYLVPYAWQMPSSAGGMSSYTLSSSSITPSANLAAGRNLSGSAACVITVASAQLDQIVSGTGSSSMAISVASASLVGSASMTASSTMSISGSASIGAIISAVASSSCSISGAGSTLTALAFMEASAGGPTPLSPEGLAEAVWETLASTAVAGTMGEQLVKAKSAAENAFAVSA